jgi:hypothetical protein
VGLDDMVSTESAFVAAATAAVLSPKARHTIRRGAVYGVAGVLKAGDLVTGAARGVVHGIRGDGSEAGANGAPTAAARGSGSTARTGRSSRANGPSGPGTSARRAAGSTKASGSAAGS